ncbi:hypothetical protein A247_27580 [Pseudomonas syringae pv. actinidiae ICMP 19099]|nr:hypothetical protein A247_27580 [Pseudomonas syringae pv. actinidiae ICMP 19099]
MHEAIGRTAVDDGSGIAIANTRNTIDASHPVPVKALDGVIGRVPWRRIAAITYVQALQLESARRAVMDHTCTVAQLAKEIVVHKRLARHGWG